MTHAFRPAVLLVALAALAGAATPARAQEWLCDPSFEDCRAPLLAFIENENVGIDVAFWFMEDARYADALIRKFNQGIPVRIIMDTQANAAYPANAPIVEKLKNAGIPMLEKTSGGIVHWKTMIFAGQNQVEFSGANFSPHAFKYVQPYVDYIDEVIYFTNDASIVNSFKTRFDDHWTASSGFTPYANITAPRERRHATFPIDPEMNFPPQQNFATRSVGRYNAENQKIDSIMFRITDRRHSDALIAAMNRGVPFRLITDKDEYRDPTRLWNAYNIDLLHASGAQVRMEAHLGGLHQKSTLLYGQQMTIFGSSNWTSPSASSQLEHNIFTKKPWFFEYFRAQFERKWNNSTGNVETMPFVPLPPDTPAYHSPANGAQNQNTTVTLRWNGGVWAHKYDVLVGTEPSSMTPVLVDRELGPSDTPTDYLAFTVTNLLPSTTYYWQVRSRTMANVEKAGPVWSFRTTGEAPAAGPLDAVLYASKAPVIAGNWSVVADTSAAGGARLSNPNLGAPRASNLAAPVDYFEMKFWADAGVPYRMWLRGKATSNSWANDSVYVQFSDSVTAGGAPVLRIGTTSAAAVTIEDCTSCGLSGWGWNDNAYGAGALGDLVYFETTGEHTIRIQVREDGLSLDQIVLSRDKFLQSSPGLTKDDGTILKEFPGATSDGNTPPPPTGPAEIVLHAANGAVAGAWQIVDDLHAASGKAAVLPDAGRAKVTTASASPADYLELTFTAEANTPYHLWFRGRATANSKNNDSVHVQFTGAVDGSGNPAYEIGTTSSVEMNLEHCSGCGLSGWGWQDNGWGSPDALGPNIRFTTAGTKTIRIQNREDGFFIDQIVLSPAKYLGSAPGTNKDDATILPATEGGSGEPPPPPPPPPPPAQEIVLHAASAALAGAWTLVDDATAASGKAAVLPDAGRPKVKPAVANPTDYFELTFTADANTAYRLWIRGRAEGESPVNDSVHVQFDDTVNAQLAPIYRIGTTSMVEVNLEDCSGCGNSGWGWEDNGWGTPDTLGPTLRFATSGVKTMRIQNREDGFYIDQIVLSPAAWLYAPPGANKDDTTILEPTDP
jgi:phosphatidylserine/phosphatidylglycerophosphate/cardiolipin synthase-like enzyme